MNDFILIRPSKEYAEEIRTYRQEFLEQNSSMDGCGSLRRTENPLEWIEASLLEEKKENCPADRVPATQFLYVRKSDGRVVGMIQIRHCLNEYLEKYAGHIGYSVRPSQRKKGYAKQMLKEALPFCKKLDLDRVMIACIDNNEGSRRTILSNGGVYDRTVFEPDEGVNLEQYWIEIK